MASKQGFHEWRSILWESRDSSQKECNTTYVCTSKHYSICHYYNSYKKYHFFESAAVLLSRYSPLFYLIWTLNSLHIIEWVQSMEPISGSEFDHARVTLWNSWLIRFWMCNWRNDRQSHDDHHHLSRKSHLKWKIRYICKYVSACYYHILRVQYYPKSTLWLSKF